MKKLLRWSLWLWIFVVIWAAFFYAPLPAGFTGLDGTSPQSGRIVFFHVPMAVTSFFAFLAAAFWGTRFLWKRNPRDDHASAAAVEVGIVFCVLATVTGAVWAQVQWGAFWNWDPRQISIALAMLYYGAYLNLRSAVEDPEKRARLSAAYASLGFVVAPFLYFIMPRMASFSLHPTPAGTRMDPSISLVVVASILGFTALFFWIHSLRRRTLELFDRLEELD
jgi:heme exporter protein C